MTGSAMSSRPSASTAVWWASGRDHSLAAGSFLRRVLWLVEEYSEWLTEI
ncbi:MAG: hypothetical protein ACLTMP_09520 [Eggerthella lenta]